MPGLPVSIENKGQLKKFINQFLWINVFHTTSNYATVPDFIPFQPTKIYKYSDGRPITFFEAIPDKSTSVVSLSFQMFFILSRRRNEVDG